MLNKWGNAHLRSCGDGAISKICGIFLINLEANDRHPLTRSNKYVSRPSAFAGLAQRAGGHFSPDFETKRALCLFRLAPRTDAYNPWCPRLLSNELRPSHRARSAPAGKACMTPGYAPFYIFMYLVAPSKSRRYGELVLHTTHVMAYVEVPQSEQG